MKKIVILSFFAATLFVSASSLAEVMHGSCVLNNVKIKELTCFGPATLNGVTVDGALSVFGSLQMTKTMVNGSVHVKGPLTSLSSTVKGPLIIYGSISASTTTFNSNIFSYSTDVKLNKSEVKGSVSIESNDKAPLLELTDHAMVKGNITFPKKAGVVKLDQGSEIAGTLENGSKQNN